MARNSSGIDSLTKLLDGSDRPIYAIDSDRRIVYCNRALAAWLEMKPARIVGRVVEYHSEPPDDDEQSDEGPLTDLCPPPAAFSGVALTGTLSCMARGGRLVHRRAEFVPLGTGEKVGRKTDQPATHHGVLAMLGAENMSTQEIALGVSADPTADELHRTIRRFRRAQASRYSIESLLGGSLAMQKVRAQLAAAAASGANTLVCGPPGSGRGHAARAIHYFSAPDSASKLIPVDCRLLSDDLLRRILERLRSSGSTTAPRPTLLLENLEQMAAAHQSLLASAIQEKLLLARLVATTKQAASNTFEAIKPSTNGATINIQVDEADAGSPERVDPALLSAISTITVELPPLVDRIEDLPILAQYFLEASNHGSSKQVGAFRREALDRMALYSWPGQLDQLHEVVTAAHRATKTHEISAADLPPILQHASQAAKHSRREPERIVLNELLASIEKEAIVRALAQANGNKSEAAVLLGMTRPRLYRRLIQLGLAREGDEAQVEQPEFIERDPTE